MLKEAQDPETEASNQAGKDDAMAMILQQAGKSAAEVAALSTLDDADRSAESQFSGEAPTITSLFGKGKAREFHAGKFAPSADVAKVMGECLDFFDAAQKGRHVIEPRKDVVPG